MTIFRKSFVTLGLTTLGLAAALVLSVLVFMNSLYYETNAKALRDSARALLSVAGEKNLADYFAAAAAQGTGRVSPPGGLRGLQQDSALRLTLIDPSGEVLWDSLVEEELVNHLDREEIQAALEGREGNSWRHSKSAGMRQIYAALPVRGDGGAAGVFRLSFTVPSFWRRVAPAAMPFFFLSFFLAAAALAEIYAFSRSLSLSMDRLVKIAGTASETIAWPVISGAEETAGASETREFLTLEQALRGMAAELNRRIERARAEGGRLEAILNSMDEAVFAADENLDLRLVNPRAKKIFNLGNRNVHVLSLLEATRSTELEAAARAALLEGRSLELELKLRAGNAALSGAEQHFQVFAAPLLSSAPDQNARPAGFHAAGTGSGGGVVLVLQDITRLVRLEQVRKDFVANVSHELRTPIQLIKGYSETLLDALAENPAGPRSGEDSPHAEQMRRQMEIIRKNAAIMENLVSDLLMLASIEHDAQKPPAPDVNESMPRGAVPENFAASFEGADADKCPPMEKQNLAPLVAEAVSALEMQGQKKQIEFNINCPREINAKVHGAYIIQALINLLDNAVKYSPENSRVWITARRENNPDCVVLEVRDEGIGIPAEHLGRIFERFYRVDRTHSREAGGTGLGLSIVRHIALLHGGAAEVESRPGEGSLFRIRLPR
jgi:two-component system phosphate regulon sensor histidine kinase PhoR